MENKYSTIGWEIGPQPIIVRTLGDYLLPMGEAKPCLLPYSETLFQHESPEYICQLITKLSPIRLYLYGNNESIYSNWSDLMINQETTVMEDEDSWCAFIENGRISDEMKWNIGSSLGGKWQVKRISPICLTELDRNLRFQSALRRAFKTFGRRQIEVTSEIFARHDKCVREGFIQLEVTNIFLFCTIQFFFLSIADIVFCTRRENQFHETLVSSACDRKSFTFAS